MEHKSNDEKAHRICETITSIYGVDIAQEAHVYSAVLEAMQWKDEQLIEQLTAFAQHLNKRGAFRDDLCMDFEHEAQSFIESQKKGD